MEASERRFEGGNDRARGGKNRAGLLHVEVAGQAVGETVLYNRQRLLLRVYVVAGNFQSPLITARFDIVARDFAEQRDEHIAFAELRGGDLRLGRFRRAACAAEHVNFPRGIETRLIHIIFIVA